MKIALMISLLMAACSSQQDGAPTAEKGSIQFCVATAETVVVTASGPNYGTTTFKDLNMSEVADGCTNVFNIFEYGGLEDNKVSITVGGKPLSATKYQAVAKYIRADGKLVDYPFPETAPTYVSDDLKYYPYTSSQSGLVFANFSTIAKPNSESCEVTFSTHNPLPLVASVEVRSVADGSSKVGEVSFRKNQKASVTVKGHGQQFLVFSLNRSTQNGEAVIDSTGHMAADEAVYLQSSGNATAVTAEKYTVEGGKALVMMVVNPDCKMANDDGDDIKFDEKVDPPPTCEELGTCTCEDTDTCPDSCEDTDTCEEPPSTNDASLHGWNAQKVAYTTDAANWGQNIVAIALDGPEIPANSALTSLISDAVRTAGTVLRVALVKVQTAIWYIQAKLFSVGRNADGKVHPKEVYRATLVVRASTACPIAFTFQDKDDYKKLGFYYDYDLTANVWTTLAVEFEVKHESGDRSNLSEYVGILKAMLGSCAGNVDIDDMSMTYLRTNP